MFEVVLRLAFVRIWSAVLVQVKGQQQEHPPGGVDEAEAEVVDGEEEEAGGVDEVAGDPVAGRVGSTWAVDMRSMTTDFSA